MENPFQVKTNSIKLKQVEEFYRTVRWLIPSCWICFYIPCPWLSTVLQYLIPFKWVTSKPSEECSPWLLEITPITHFPCKSGLDVWLMFLRYRVWFFRTWKWWKFNLLKNSRKEWWRTSLLFELFSLHFYYKWKFIQFGNERSINQSKIILEEFGTDIIGWSHILPVGHVVVFAVEMTIQSHKVPFHWTMCGICSHGELFKSIDWAMYVQ